MHLVLWLHLGGIGAEDERKGTKINSCTEKISHVCREVPENVEVETKERKRTQRTVLRTVSRTPQHDWRLIPEWAGDKAPANLR